uniref:Uncharacterized protein n=1 Tax=Avena sativa TaxID=4498 RepID=A0ACD5UE21_AVESA
MIRRLLLLFCFLFSVSLTRRQLALAAAAASTSKVVTSLPGFHGRLPFHLETGYVEVDEDNGTELFYYFVESEAGGENDPFLLWLTGGDHCTVLSGLAFGIGPFQFVTEPYNGTMPSLEINPNSWTKVAHILFVDSPVGTGFSFSKQPQGYDDVGEVSSSLQLHEFLIKWFTEHPKFLSIPLYIGGDSLAGKVVPFIGQKITEGIEAGRRPLLNLKGYLIGNPVTGEMIDETSKVPYAHGFGIISDQLYETILGHCQGQDYRNPTNLLCAQSLGTFHTLLSEVMVSQILADKCVYASVGPAAEEDDPTGSRRKILSEEAGIKMGKRLKNPPVRPPLHCVHYVHYLSYFWANDKHTRDALGIKKGTVDEWVRCRNGDMPYGRDIDSSIKYHRNLTAKGYRALVYSGDHDSVVPFLGTQAWVRSLGFPIVDDWRAWHLHGQSAGFTVTYSNNMTFATVKGAGHTAPEYEPERCFTVFSRWILNKPV